MASASREEQRSVIRFFAIQCESAANIHKKLVDVTCGVTTYAVQRFELEKKSLKREGERARLATCREAEDNGHGH